MGTLSRDYSDNKNSNDNLVDAIIYQAAIVGDQDKLQLQITRWNDDRLLITDTIIAKSSHKYTASTTTTFDDVNDRVKVEQNSLNIFSIQNQMPIQMIGTTLREHLAVMMLI